MKILNRVVGFCFLCSLAVQAKPPNVVFILADDLGIGGLHCYREALGGDNYMVTPNIDKLYEQGMHFSNGLAAYPTCRPSRAALLSGQYGPRTGIYRVKDSYGDEDKAKYKIPENHQLSTDKITLGTAFKNAGYATAMYGKWHVTNSKQTHPTAFGFDEAFVSEGKHYKGTSIPPLDLPDGMMIEELLTAKAMAFMEKAVGEEKPFFVFMPYFLVHKPLEARQDYIDQAKKRMAGKELITRGSKTPEVLVAMTQMLDDFSGQLLGKLVELGVEEETIVVFTSDNGSYDYNFTGGFRGRKGETYDGGMRVPYIFKWPGKIKAGSSSGERIIGVDIYPTLLGLAGIEPPKDYTLDGADLTPVLKGKTPALAAREIYCFYPKYVQFKAKTGKWNFSWRNVIYDGNYKVIEYPEYDEYELFNLTDDPKEKKNLAMKSPEKRDALTQKLHRWLKDIDAPKLEPNPDYTLD